MQRIMNQNIAVILSVMMTVLFIPTVSFASNEADTIYYSVDAGDVINFDEDDFNEVCTDLNDDEADLDYIYFGLPDSDDGILYYDYDGDDEEEADDSDEYYYDEDPSISDVTFAADEDCSDTVTISYDGYDLDGNHFYGDIVIDVDETEDDEDTEGDIEYDTDENETITFDEDDFNDFCQDENDEDLDFVYFELPDSDEGTLYYDYDGDDEEEIDDDEEYYYDDDPSISDITFVPADDYTGDFMIDFEGYDENGDTIEGTILITVEQTELDSVDTIYFSGMTGSAVPLIATYFNSKCEDLTGSTLDYIEFDLPDESDGTLYYYYTSPTDYQSMVYSSEKYYYEDEAPYLKDVSFAPYGNEAGETTILYTGYAMDGSAYTGEIEITYSATEDQGAVISGTDNTGSIYFSDVDESYSWAAAFIDSLYVDGIATGEIAADNTRSFRPASSITRGEFMVLLSRVLSLQSDSAADNFADVAAENYYYDDIAIAKSLGIAQGADNLFLPDASITREDAMVLALRAMNASGTAVTAGSTDDLYAYSDNGSVSDYAAEAIAALIQSGIITGNIDGQIHPKDNITRAEAAAIIYRIKH